LLFSPIAIAVLVQGWNANAVSSRVIFTGKDTTKPGSALVDIFKYPVNHATAVASIIAHLARTTNFNPKTQGLNVPSSVYDDFYRKVIGFSEFDVEIKRMELLQVTGDLKEFKREITRVYKSPAGSNVPVDAEVSAFVDQVSKLVPGAKSGRWMLSLLSIYKNPISHHVTFNLASAEVNVIVNNQGAITLQQQEIGFKQVIGPVDFEGLVDNAASLAKQVEVLVTIDQLNDLLTTPSKNSLESWLFDSELDYDAESSQKTYSPRRQRLCSF
jgi:hypothetical protein